MIEEPKSQEAVDTGYESFSRNMAVMQAIVQEMKEIAVLPSEKPTDVTPLEKVEFPPEGGILTYMGGHEHPYRGFPFYEFVDRIDLIKKISRAALSSIYHETNGASRLKLLTLLPALWFAKIMVGSLIYVFFRVIERFRIKTIRYSQAMRELHRAFSAPRVNENRRMLRLRPQLRDLLCMILEFDNAYRYRLQDLMEYMDKEALRKNPAKEFGRLLSILSEHEVSQEIKDTWKLYNMALVAYLRFDRKMLYMLRDVFLEIEIDRIKMTVEDVHWAKGRKDYIFRFMKN